MMSAGGQDQAGGEMTYMAMGTTPRDRADSRAMQPNVAYHAANDGVPRLDSTGSRGMQPNVAYATVDDLVAYSPTQMGDDGDMRCCRRRRTAGHRKCHRTTRCRTCSPAATRPPTTPSSRIILIRLWKPANADGVAPALPMDRPATDKCRASNVRKLFI